MTESGYGAVELSRSECLSLLGSAPFGRLVLTECAMPVVLAVNFVLLPDGIVIRTRAGSTIDRAAATGAVVAFEADEIDPHRRTGWTVTVVGPCHLVQDPLEQLRLAELPLTPWVGGDRSQLVVVELGPITGRRIGGAEPAHAAASTF